MLVILLDLTHVEEARGFATGVCVASSRPSPELIECLDIRSSRPEGEEMTTTGAESARGRVNLAIDCVVGVARETPVKALATGVRNMLLSNGVRGVVAEDSAEYISSVVNALCRLRLVSKFESRDPFGVAQASIAGVSCIAVRARAVGVAVTDVATDESPRAGVGLDTAGRLSTRIPGWNMDVFPIVRLYLSPTFGSSCSFSPCVDKGCTSFERDRSTCLPFHLRCRIRSRSSTSSSESFSPSERASSRSISNGGESNAAAISGQRSTSARPLPRM
jgi:hypothetical protein